MAQTPHTPETKELIASALFDADWYRDTYRDVTMTGMDPALHYMRYGYLMDRDPSPGFSTVFNRTALRGIKPTQEPVTVLQKLRKASPDAPVYDERAVLPAAYRESQLGSHDRAIALAQAHLPPAASHTLHVLRANRAIHLGDEAGWSAGLSAYLAHFGAPPVTLGQGNDLLDRLSAPAPVPVTDGPLVSVLMPAWNCESTVGAAARSILNQSWRNLELLIVDDCSTDGTWGVLQAVAAQDSRVRVMRNPVNVGPYVSKNVALGHARGDWVTGHDSDDWALPDRITQHMKAVKAEDTPPRASLTHMIRVELNGHFGTIRRRSGFSPDGVARVASISTLFRRAFLTETLGSWDCVRFGADSEMIARTQKSIGKEFRTYPFVGMICMSMPTSLTNNPDFGVSAATGLSPVRVAYRDAWTQWHQDLEGDAFVAFPNLKRGYAAPDQMLVPVSDVLACKQN